MPRLVGGEHLKIVHLGNDMKKFLFFLLLFCVTLGEVNQAAADNTTCPAVSDVYIDQYSPDENFNAKTRLLVSYHPTKGIARGLLKFTIPESIDASYINKATLHLSGSRHTGGGVSCTVSFFALNASFDENTSTWNSLSGGNFDNSTGSQGILPENNDWYTTIDVTTLIKDRFTKVRTNGILMKLAKEGPDKVYQSVASRECDNASNADYVEADEPPRLEIVYSLPASTTTSSESTTTTSAESTTTTSEQTTSSTTSIPSGGGGGGGGGGGSLSSTTTAASTSTTSVQTTSTTTAVEPPPVTTTTSVEGCTDNDQDGYFAEGGDCGEKDCNDNDNTISPAADEVCDDGRDNDCDGVFDEDCGVTCQIKTFFPKQVKRSDGGAIYFIIFGGTGCKTGLGLGQMLTSTVDFQSPDGLGGIKSAGSIAAGNIVIGLLQIDSNAMTGVYYVYVNSRRTDVSGASLTLIE